MTTDLDETIKRVKINKIILSFNYSYLTDNLFKLKPYNNL